MPFIKIMPIIIFACLALLAVRVADIIDRQQSLSQGLFISPLQAEEASAGDDAKEETAEEPDEGGEEKQGSEEDAGNAEKEGADGKSVKDRAMSNFSETEVEILQRLAERRKKLATWEEDIAFKQSILKLTEDKVDRKLTELRALKVEVEKVLEKYNAEEDAKIQSLVKIYENMKAKDAANIFNTLDTNVLLQVIDKMKERSSAPILAKMNPSRAKQITTELAEQNRITPPTRGLE